MFTLTKELTKQYKESFQSKPERIVAQNAAVKNGLKDLVRRSLLLWKISRYIRLIWNTEK